MLPDPGAGTCCVLITASSVLVLSLATRTRRVKTGGARDELASGRRGGMVWSNEWCGINAVGSGLV